MNHLELNENEMIKIDLKDFKITFEHEMSYLIEYFDINTRMIEKRRKQLDEFLDSDIKENPTIEYELREMYHLDYLKLPSYFYHSSIVTLYSLLENNMNTICTKIQTDTDFVIGLNELYGHNLIDKAKSFLVKIANIDFKKVDKEWQRISDFQKLRNIIVHQNSQLNKNQSTKKLLLKFKEIKIYELENYFHITEITLIREFLFLIQSFISKIIKEIEEKQFKKFSPASSPIDFSLLDNLPF